MTTEEKYGVLQRAASLVASQTDRASLLAHHERIHTVIKNMLMGRKRSGPRRTDGVTKDNPTGNPFKYLRKPVPTVVSSAQDRSMAARRAASDASDASFD